jgi:hypothetical protein
MKREGKREEIQSGGWNCVSGRRKRRRGRKIKDEAIEE